MKPASIFLSAAAIISAISLSNSAEASPSLLPPANHTITWYNNTMPAAPCSFISVKTLSSNGAVITEKTNNYGTELAHRKSLIINIPSAGCSAIKLTAKCGQNSGTRDIGCSSGMAEISGLNPPVINFR